MPFIDLIGGSYQASERNLSGQRTINLYTETTQQGAKVSKVLKQTAGAITKLLISANITEICRGMYVSSSGPAPDLAPRIYGVWGDKLIRFNQAISSFQVVGTIANNGEKVSITDNGFDVVLADGESLWASEMSADDGLATLRYIDTPYVPGSLVDKVKPTHVAFYKQRLVINNKQSNTFHFSKLALTEFDTVGNLDFYSAESSSDPIIALEMVNGALWIWGTRSFEVWRSQNNQDDPYTYVGGSQSSIGCKARQSTAVLENYCFWLGSSDIGSDRVFMGTGTDAKDITGTIADQIPLCADRSNALGWCYADEGHLFYLLTFRSSNRTFVYDMETNEWHERMSRNLQTGAWTYYPYTYAVRYGDSIYCGTLVDGNLCELSKDAYTEHDGKQILRERVSPTFFENLSTIIINHFFVDCNVGNTALLQGQGSDPLLMLEVSFDGGYTYGDILRRSVGRQGEYKTTVDWWGLGAGREPVFRLRFSEPSALTIYQARLDYQVCED